MQLITSAEEIYKLSDHYRRHGKQVALVPTMGALHQGHLSLVEEAVSNNDVTIVSIFVNPLQFNNSADLENYPRDIEKDLALLKTVNVDLVFAPSAEEMYRSSPLVKLDFGEMGLVMEGKFRPGHFDGVGVVVSKLFHLCNPSYAYFGLKDLQQYLLMRRMVEDLSFSTKLVGMPIVREESGLAMSSRNQRLSMIGLRIATNLYKGLQLAEQCWREGKSVDETKNTVFSFYSQIGGLDIEYFQVVDSSSLREVTDNVAQEVAFCVAGYVEGVRLIDNLYLRQD